MSRVASLRPSYGFRTQDPEKRWLAGRNTLGNLQTPEFNYQSILSDSCMFKSAHTLNYLPVDSQPRGPGSIPRLARLDLGALVVDHWLPITEV
jgi:hypothetical protein